MSFIHLHKSVVTFHFKEILEDGHLGHPLTLVGLGALLIAPNLISKMASQNELTEQRSPQALPSPTGLKLSEWVAIAQHQQYLATLQDDHSPHVADTAQRYGAATRFSSDQSVHHVA